MNEKHVFSLLHFKDTTKLMYLNGGKLRIGSTAITITYLFRTVAVLQNDSLSWEILPDDPMDRKTVRISDGTQSYECLFFRKDFQALQDALSQITPNHISAK